MFLVIIGGFLNFVAFFWMLVVQIQNKNYIWGVASLLLFLPAYIYGFLNLDLAKKPFLLLVVSMVIIFVGFSTLSPDQMEQLRN